MTYRIMIVEDDAAQRQALVTVLRRQLARDDVHVEGFADGLHALHRAQTVPFAVVIADFHMPGMNGVGFLRRMRDLQPNATRLMLTASTDAMGTRDGADSGVTA